MLHNKKQKQTINILKDNYHNNISTFVIEYFSSCSTSATLHVTLVNNPMIKYK